MYKRSHDDARALCRKALRDHAGCVTEAAKALGVSRPFFHWVMRKIGISREAIAIRAEAGAYFRLPPLPARGNQGEEP